MQLAASKIFITSKISIHQLERLSSVICQITIRIIAKNLKLAGRFSFVNNQNEGISESYEHLLENLENYLISLVI